MFVHDQISFITFFRNNGNTSQGWTVALYDDATLIGSNTISALSVYTPDTPQVIGTTSNVGFNKRVLIRGNVAAPQGSDLIIENFKYGQ